MVLVVIVFVYSAANDRILRQLFKLVSDLAIIASSDIHSLSLRNIITSPSTTVPTRHVIVSTNQATASFVVLSVYWKVVLLFIIKVFNLRNFGIVVLLLLCRVETAPLIGKHRSPLRRIRIIIHVPIPGQQRPLIVVPLSLLATALQATLLPGLCLTHQLI